MVFNHEFDTGEMHLDAFTERARFTYQHPAPLAQGVIDGLHEARAAAACGAAAVLPAGLRRCCQRGKTPTSLSYRLVKYQQRGSRQRAGGCCHKRRAAARLRRLSRSTASQSHTLCFLAPTNVQILSNFSAGHHFLAPFLGLQAAPAGLFFSRPNRAPRDGGCPHNTALRVAPGLQLVHLRVLRRWRWRREQTGPGSGRPGTGSGRGPDDGHFAESGRCRMCRRNEVCKPQSFIRPSSPFKPPPFCGPTAFAAKAAGAGILCTPSDHRRYFNNLEILCSYGNQGQRRSGTCLITGKA